MGHCIACGSSVGEYRFCPNCGVEQAAPKSSAPPGDVLVGTTVADRYTLVELLGSGGMAKVYRARQKLLDRDVALKLIHPDLTVSEETRPRFIAEARSASRLNHPNVVSIFDFGVAASGQLYLAMELLHGRDLATVMEQDGPPSHERTADVLCQVLAALHEAHEIGITHRDIKPENIFLETSRDGTDRVKVIDFGIATARAVEGERVSQRRITQGGQLVGTPYFMAPELISGASGPSVDLYAVGVCLFAMLTGRVPFDGERVMDVLQKHASAPRPDPRAVAPHRTIPDALAEVCLRALSIDPAKRFPTAHALAEAIHHAVNPESWARDEASLFPARSSRPANMAQVAEEAAASTQPPASTQQGSAPPISSDGRPFVGRAADLAWGEGLLRRTEEVRAILYFGPQGSGRSRLAHELGEALRRSGSTVLSAHAHGPPAWEAGYGWLRRAITALAGPHVERARTSRGDAKEIEVAEGLGMIFGESPPAGAAPHAVRKTVKATLEWAATVAVKAHATPGAPVVLLVDDADCLDGVSHLALSDMLLSNGWFPGLLRVVMTCERAPDTTYFQGVHVRSLGELSIEDAAALAEGVPLEGRPLLPLYIEQARRLVREEATDDPPGQLRGIVEWRVRSMPVARRRVVQALAVLGPVPLQRLLRTLARPEDLAEAWGPLSQAGFVRKEGPLLMLTHAIFTQVVLETAPAGALADLRARAADALDDDAERRELRAVCALGGRPDFEAFFLVEQVARLRSDRGDEDGAVASLYEGLRAARSQLSSSDAESAASAVVVFSRKLGEALLRVGRTDEGYGVLSEALDLTPPESVPRALLFEQLARALEQRGKHGEAAERRRLAQTYAERAGDAALAARLKEPDARPITGVRRVSWLPRRSLLGLEAARRTARASS